MNITIHGFKGTADELKELLIKGIYVEEIKENKKSFRVSFSAKSRIHAGKTSRFKDDFEEMYNTRRTGESNTSIDDRFGCSHANVIKIVKKMEQNRKEELEEMYNAHRAGESNTSIGNRFGYSPKYVKKIVKRISRERNFNSQ